MQVFLTVLSGAGVFVVGQIVLRFILEPILAHKEVIGKISFRLVFDGNVYSSPQNWEQEVSSSVSMQLRTLSSEILSTYYAIPFCKLFSKVRLLRTEKEVNDAAKGLMYLSNVTSAQRQSPGKDPFDVVVTIRNSLGFPTS